jgi:6-phosphogluconate dehydrogenase
MNKKRCDIGLIGLAVMGQNLVLNVERNGYSVGVYNRTTARTEEFMEERAQGRAIRAATTIEELVDLLQRPRSVMLLVKAGWPVDAVIEELIPHLEPGDLIIDGGNSFFKDTERRSEMLEDEGILYIGTGVSGGEYGALHGPSIMPGGPREAYDRVAPIFEDIAARADGEPCVAYMGPRGAGHYVKMVHNGIEYGDMELISESYFIMKHLLGMTNEEMSDVFAAWDEGKLDSYLIEITRDILSFQDGDGEYPIDYILDAAGQKGTGKWTAISSLEMGIPLTLIGEAVQARFLSALVEERKAASRVLEGPEPRFEGDRGTFLEDLHDALYASKIISYTQGFMLLRAASEEYDYNLQLKDIAKVWRAGCIIRSVFLGNIMEAFEASPDLANLLLDDYFREEVDAAQPAWRRVVSEAVRAGLPVPAMASALTFYDGYRRERVSANMIQAQRDYFGAHTYERVDKPRGEHFHTDWIGSGGDVTSGSYTA